MTLDSVPDGPVSAQHSDENTPTPSRTATPRTLVTQDHTPSRSSALLNGHRDGKYVNVAILVVLAPSHASRVLEVSRLYALSFPVAFPDLVIYTG